MLFRLFYKTNKYIIWDYFSAISQKQGGYGREQKRAGKGDCEAGEEDF